MRYLFTQRTETAHCLLSDRRHQELLVKFSRVDRSSRRPRRGVVPTHLQLVPTAESNPDGCAETAQRVIEPRNEVLPVLIVDSYNDEGEMYAEYLRSVGARAKHVRTPEEALSLMEFATPSVIVADMVFPGSLYDGPAFMRAVRALPSCAATNCIIVSGFPRMLDRQRAREAGADLFLLKPCAPDELRWHVVRAASAHDRNTRTEWNWPD